VGNHIIAVVGGTGPQGKALALRFARAGHEVVIGSRSAERAEVAASEIRDRVGEAVEVRGLDNPAAAEAAGIVLLAVPWDGHKELVSGLAPHLAGKLVISCVNPLGFDKRGAYALAVGEGSAAEEAAAVLPESRVVAAFHHVSAKLLLDGDGPVDTDVLVLGDDREAKDQVIELVRAVKGMRGIDAGALRLAAHVEGMTASLIAMNRRYRAHAGLRVTDV
jgi:NADPH-dependent F420 reductase